MTSSGRQPSGPFLASTVVSTQWLADHLGADGLEIVAGSVCGESIDQYVRTISSALPTSSTIIVVDYSDDAGSENAGSAGGGSAGDGTDVGPAEGVAAKLRHEGFVNVATLRGGYARWVHETRPSDLDSLSHLVQQKTRIA